MMAGVAAAVVRVSVHVAQCRFTVLLRIASGTRDKSLVERRDRTFMILFTRPPEGRRSAPSHRGAKEASRLKLKAYLHSRALVSILFLALLGAEGNQPPWLRSLQEGRQFKGSGSGCATRRPLAPKVGQPPAASRQPSQAKPSQAKRLRPSLFRCREAQTSTRPEEPPAASVSSQSRLSPAEPVPLP